MALRFTGSDERDRKIVADYVDKLSTLDFAKFKQIMEETDGGLHNPKAGDRYVCEDCSTSCMDEDHLARDRFRYALMFGAGIRLGAGKPYDKAKYEKALNKAVEKVADWEAWDIDRVLKGQKEKAARNGRQKSSLAQSRAFGKAMREGRMKDAGELIYRPPEKP